MLFPLGVGLGLEVLESRPDARVIMADVFISRRGCSAGVFIHDSGCCCRRRDGEDPQHATYLRLVSARVFFCWIAYSVTRQISDRIRRVDEFFDFPASGRRARRRSYESERAGRE